jgi:3-hydroxyacyl-CoA dehydrogenase
MVDGARPATDQKRDGAVLIISLTSPPVNALSRDVRSGLAAALDAAEAPDVGAVVIRGEGPCFSAGADISEFGSKGAGPDLANLCNRIEAFPKPIIACLHGVVLGGGLELALAAHVRVATQTARLGFPEVSLGLLPGAGGTQRLPRLVGAREALRLMLTGQPVGAVEALAMGVLDQVVEGDPFEAAMAAARSQIGRQPVPTAERRDGMRDGVAYQDALRAARQDVRDSRLPAPARIIDCVEAALLLPFDQGEAFERAAFEDLVGSPESAGLRHAFLSERRAAKPPRALAAVSVPSPRRLAFWGAAGPAADMALAALKAGLRVTLADPVRELLVAALEHIAARQEADVAAGRLTPEARDADWARLTPQLSPETLTEAEVVIVSRPDTTGDVLAGLRSVVLALGVPTQRGMIGLSLTEGDKPLAELAQDDQVAPARVAGALAFARRMGWRPVLVGPGPSVALRLATVLAETVTHLENHGLSRAEIAAALAAYGIAGEGRARPGDAVAQKIARRCFGALANEGARLIQSGKLRRPCEVDAIAIAAGLVARWTGGPMYQADQRGVMVLRADLRLWATDAPELWTPSPLFDRLISGGKTLDALNRAQSVMTG